MCGICGFFLIGHRGERRSLQRMAEKLAHRGPDDRAWYLESFSRPEDRLDGEVSVGLAHRRLSIIDLSWCGRQPMFSEDRGVVLVFNGEIYNFRTLRRELESRGHRFSSCTDTEAIVHGYEEWGEEIFSKLNGMFALAIWDRKMRKLTLARDRLGIKPLYYYRKGRILLFASEIHALKEHPLFEPTLDLSALGQYLSFSYVPAPKTIYSDTFKLLPGEYLLARGESVSKRRYWDLTASLDGKSKELSFEEAKKKCENLIRESVEMRLVSDVPLGAFLSGGYDSSLIVAMMKASGARDIKTFTVGFEEGFYNEAPYAKRVADFLGTDHHELILTPGETIATMEKLAFIYDEPFGDYSALPTYLVSRFARSCGMVVALSGDGGDEVFRGYPRYTTTAKLLRVARLPKAARRLALGMLRLVPGQRWRRLALASRFESIESLYHHRISTWKQGKPEALLACSEWQSGKKAGAASLDPDGLSGCVPADSLFADTLFYRIFSKLKGLDPIHSLSLVDIYTYMVDDILTKVDRASMAVSLEVRVPLLDHRLVEFASSLPSSFHVQNGLGKAIIRAISEDLFPRKLLDRPKRGFSIPVEPWLKGPLKGLLLSELSPGKLEKEGVLDGERVSGLLRGFLEGKQSCGRLIWSLLMLELWLKNASSSITDKGRYGEEKVESMHAHPKLFSAYGRE